jgi:phosphotriesterase-related protein
MAVSPPGLQGVQGWLAPDSLGITQPHEHCSIDLTPAYDPVYRFVDLDVVATDLAAAGAAGLRTIVDVGTNEHKRSPEFLVALAERTGVQVVAATGFWRDGFHPAYLADEPVERAAEHLIRDLTEGIGDGVIRAGVIGEIGSDAAGFSEIADKAFRACAIAQQATNVAFITHTPEGADAITQLDLLLEVGVDPGRLLIGHVDCLDDIEVHTRIADSGAFVGYDRVGLLHYQSDEVRIRLVLDMIDRGFADRLILSTDMANMNRLRVNGGLGFSTLLEGFVPRLREAGVDEAVLRQILVDNPRRLLTGV